MNSPQAEEARLLAAAAAARRNAYAPYSGYCVGAAVLTADGTVFTGCNIENCSYGLTICAERVAVFSAVAAGQTAIRAVAVVAAGPGRPWPCGACRQVLAEFAELSCPVYVATADDLGNPERLSLADLLPRPFSPRSLPGTH